MFFQHDLCSKNIYCNMLLFVFMTCNIITQLLSLSYHSEAHKTFDITTDIYLHFQCIVFLVGFDFFSLRKYSNKHDLFSNSRFHSLCHHLIALYL